MRAFPVTQVLRSAPETQLCKNFLISRSICIGINYIPNEKQEKSGLRRLPLLSYQILM